MPKLPRTAHFNQLVQTFQGRRLTGTHAFKLTNICSQRVHVPLSLTDTLQLYRFAQESGLAPIEVINLGADGSFVLPNGTDADLGPLPLLPVTAALPRGSYEFSCRMLDPVTGELLTEDRNFFEIQIPIIYAIGDTGPAGGIVFFVTPDGLHGLEAALTDQNDPHTAWVQWGCNGTSVPGANVNLGRTGAQNTAEILAGCGTFDIAARWAVVYTLNGFDDWFLPSIDELNLLYLQKDVVGVFTSGSSRYWSSSTLSSTTEEYAFGQDFSDGAKYGFFKNTALRVRAIRAF